MPILLVKRRNARHPLRVSNAPTSFSDIAPTILSLAGVPLEDGQRTIFDIEEGEDRERVYLHYQYPNREDPYLDRLVEYRVRGLTWKPSSWRQEAVHRGPHSDFNNDRIDMGGTEYRHHERDWWLQGADSKDRKRTVAYTVGRVAEIDVAFPDRADRTMSISMKSMVRGQVLDVDLNGHNLGSIALDEGARFAEYEIGLPGERLVEPASELNVIAFRPRSLMTDWRPGQQRIPYGVGIDWIAFEVD